MGSKIGKLSFYRSNIKTIATILTDYFEAPNLYRKNLIVTSKKMPQYCHSKGRRGGEYYTVNFRFLCE